MKAAHIAIVSPKLCGLYETTRELVSNLRKLGVDSRIIDPRPLENVKIEDGHDRGALLADWEWAKSADVIVSHSGFDATPVEHTNQPVVHVSHGRPLSSHISYKRGVGAPIAAYQYNHSKDVRFKTVVTFWPEHVPYLKVAWYPVPVAVVNPSVDLDAWSQSGPSGYKFHGKDGSINVVITDPWREDVDPFLSVNAFMVFAQAVPGAKLHVYGCGADRKPFQPYFNRLAANRQLGEVQGWISGLDNVYRAADLMITPHKIYTRSIREAMACGCQVVSGRDCDPEDIEQFAFQMGKRLENPVPSRALAAVLFNPIASASAFKKILENVSHGD